jgi:hypothetical protein
MPFMLCYGEVEIAACIYRSGSEQGLTYEYANLPFVQRMGLSGKALG